MKKFCYTLRALFLLMVGTSAMQAFALERVRATFVRYGTTADEVAVRLTDENGDIIPGAHATIAASADLKSSGTGVNPGVLCVNVNATATGERTYTLSITGLPEGFAYDRAQLETRALNASGAYQNEGEVRQWNLTLEQGATADALTTFGTLTDYDLNNARPSLPLFEGSGTVGAEGTLVLKLTADKGTNNGGCFIGLMRLDLFNSATGDVPAACVDDDEAKVFLVDLNNGEMSNTSVSSSYKNLWTATSTGPGLTLSVSSNDMLANGTDINLYYTVNGGGAYTLTTDEGYAIDYYAFTFTNASTSDNMTVTPADQEAVTCSGSETAYVSANGSGAQTSAFQVNSASNSTQALASSAFVVKVVPVKLPAADVNRVSLTFVRYGSTADEVAIRLTDENGDIIPGARATLATSVGLKTSGDGVNPGVLCLDANATNTESERTYTLTITGLPAGFAYDRAQLETRALNASGAYQTEGQVRQWNLTLEQGATADALTTFGTLTDYDLNSARPSLPLFQGTGTVGDEGTLVLKLTADMGTSNSGCFIGLMRLDLFNSSVVDVPEASVDDDEAKVFIVDLNNGALSYSSGSGSYKNLWTATSTAPGLTLSVSTNDMQENDALIDLYYTGNGGGVYTLTTDAGYAIDYYTFEFVNKDATVNMSVTPAGQSAITCSGSGTAYVSANGLGDRTETIQINSSTNGVKALTASSFIVKVVPGDYPVEDYTELFVTESGDTPYRIPAIAKTNDGALLALSDYRLCHYDIGNGEVDIVARISTDNGATWGDQFMVADGTGTSGNFDCGFGDAALVANSESSDVLLICAAGSVTYGASTRTNPIHVARLRSTDNGQTWTATPENITESIYSLFDNSSLGQVQALFFGSGRICQSRYVKVGEYYRLYAALCAKPGGNRVIYSDDFGETWHVLGSVDVSPAPSGDEPKCEELPDGSVLLSSRMNGGRYYNIYSYTDINTAAGQWSTAVASANYEGGVVATNNTTNGEILIIPAVENATNKNVYIALQSVPFGSGRANVGLYWKVLEADADYNTPANFSTGWDGKHQSSYLGSAYSTMTMQANDAIAFFYEEATHGADYTMVYKQYSLEYLTDNAYSYAPTTEDRVAFLQGSGLTDRLSTMSFGKVGGLKAEAQAAVEAGLQTAASTGTPEAVAAYNKLVSESSLQLESGKWYTLRNVGRSNGTLNLVPTATTMTAATAAEGNIDQLFRFDATTDGAWTLYNGNYASYVGPLKAIEAATDAVTETPGTYTVVSGLDGVSTLRCTNGVDNGNHSYMHLAGDLKRIVPWEPSETATQWYIEPVEEINIDATTALSGAVNYPFAVTLPTGLTAAVAEAYGTDAEGQDAVKVTNLTGNVVPANTPFIYTAADAAAYTLTIGGEADQPATNLLSGVLTAATVDGDCVYLYTDGTFTRTTDMSVAANTAYFMPAANTVDSYVTTTVDLASNTYDVAIDALCYVTRCFPENVDLTGSGLTAYVVNTYDDATATLTEVTGVVPSDEGVILYAATAGNYSLTSTTATATDANLSGNKLVGVLFDTELEPGIAYVLAADGAGSVEFALLSDEAGNNGGTYVPANHAYLPVNATASGQTLSFTFGTPTGIDQATLDDADTTWYTLDGVAVKSPSKGIFVNSKGKVVLFK